MKTYIVIFLESKWYSLNLDDFEEFGPFEDYHFRNQIITFQTSEVIRYFKSLKLKKIPCIIDLESFDKQFSKEGKDFQKEKEWKAILFLKRHNRIDSDFKLHKDNIKNFLEHLGGLYLDLLNRNDEEKERFQNIELRINKIIHQRQFDGIQIDLNIAKKKCETIEKDIYRLKNLLQLEHNVFTPEFEKQQLHYLKSNNFNIIHSPLYSFKIRRKEDLASQHFYELIRNQQDLSSILYILSHWGGATKTYPSFIGFGTITSRIILRQPSLQNLRKINRDLVIAEDGKKLLYIDYSEFEAGILASLSSDENLINLYGSGIYEDLAEKVLGDSLERETAKTIFYRFVYGDTSLDMTSKNYFKHFSGLVKFKKKIEEDLLENKQVGTSNGNFRTCSDGQANWALSHVVQATASLIYKKALLRVNQEVSEAEFLIPMHDATLYQITESNYEGIKNKIKMIYVEEFKKLCPKIEARVNFDSFYKKKKTILSKV